MIRTIINYIVEKYLANILEINTNETQCSLWSGQATLKNLKIKPEIFETLNMPYFELVNGYVGKLDVVLQLPRFWLYPIKIAVDKVFLHARQKSLNNFDTNEEIHLMEDYKNRKLQSVEELMSHMDELSSEPGKFQQIMNNLKIEIGEILIRFEDEISYPGTVFAFGVILNQICLLTTSDQYEQSGDNANANIPIGEINYKLVEIQDLSIYLDHSDNGWPLDYHAKIVPCVREQIPKDLWKFLDQSREFYAYAMSEIKLHSNDVTAHCYLLYQMGMTIRIALNAQLTNGAPMAALDISAGGIQTSVTLKQVSIMIKLLSYLNLKRLYRAGIYKSYYRKDLTNDEKNSYMQLYIKYYTSKYIQRYLDPEEAEKSKKTLEQFEIQLTYDQVQSIRQAAKVKMDYLITLESVEKSIQEVENNWKIVSFMRRRDDNEQLKQLREKKEKLRSLEGETNKKIQEELDGMKLEDAFKSLSDEIILYSIKLSMRTFILTLFESGNNRLVDVIFENFEIRANVAKNAQLLSIYLGDAIVKQHLLRNTQYQTIIQAYEDDILFQDRNNISMQTMTYISSLSSQSNPICHEKKGAMYIEFENNPNLKDSNYRLQIRNEKRVFIVANLYSLQYTMSKLLDCLKSSIDLNEISNYARGEVFKYIHEGHVDQIISGNYSHMSIDADICLKGPVVIVPQNIFDESNRNVLMISLGELMINSHLPPRRNLKEDYINMTDQKKLYDNYGLISQGMEISTLYGYDGNVENISKAKGNTMIDNVNLTVIIFNLIEPKNEIFENAKIFIQVSKIEINIRDSQIEYFIDFIDGMTTINQYLDSALQREKEGIEEIPKGMNEDSNLIIEQEQAKDPNPKREKLQGIKEISQVNTSSCEKRKDEVKESNKTFLLFEILVLRVELNILKSLTSVEMSIKNREDKKFMSYVVNNFTFILNLNGKKDIKASLKIQSIFLFDCDATYTPQGKEEMEINPEFQCIMASVNSQEQEEEISQSRSQLFYHQAKESPPAIADNKPQHEAKSFVEISYDFYANKNKTDIKVYSTKLLICLNLSTLLRLSRFANFFYDLYLSRMARHITSITYLKRGFTQLAELKEKTASIIKKQSLNMHFVATLKKKMTARKIAAMIKEVPQPQPGIRKPPSIAVKTVHTEPTSIPKTNKSKLSFSFEMKEIELNFPLNPRSENTKVMAFNFNMMVKLRMDKEYESFYGNVTNRLVRQNYKKNDMSVNVMIFNMDFDILNFVGNAFTISDKLLSNFRMTALMKCFLLLEKETSVSMIDIHFEPMCLILGCRQTQILANYVKSISEFLDNLKNKFEEEDAVTVTAGNRNMWVSKLSKEERSEVKKYSNYQSQIANKTKKINRKLENRVKYNTASFNSLTDISFKLDKASIQLHDNTELYHIPLLKIEASKISLNGIMNTNPTDSENMANALLEMMTGKEIDLVKFNIYNLYKYLNGAFNMEIAYYNEKVSDWEPIMEPWSAGVKLSQVAKITRMKVDIVSEVMMNINITYCSLQVFNSIMKKLMQKESEWEEEDKSISLENKTKDRNIGDEIELEFINNTGVGIVIWLDADINTKFSLETHERKTFTKNELNLIYHKLSNETMLMLKKYKFSFTILHSVPITDQDFSCNHCNIYRIPAPENHIELSITIHNTGLIKSVSFESNVEFFNNTQHKITLAMIKEQKNYVNISTAEDIGMNFDKAEKEIILNPQSKVKIPLTFLMERYMTFGKIIDETNSMKLLFEDLSFILGCYDELIEKEAQEGIGFASDMLTKKYSKVITFASDTSEISLSLDLLVLKSSSVKLKEENFVHSYSYVIVINPPVIIENQIPYDLQFFCRRVSGEEMKSIIAPLNLAQIYYLNHQDDRNDIKIGLSYLKNKYFESEYFSIIKYDTQKTIRLANVEGNDFHFLKIKYDPPSRIYTSTYQKLVKNLSHSKKLSFYVEYLIVNKTSMRLFLNKSSEITGCEQLAPVGKSNGKAYSNKVSMFHCDENKAVIRNKISEWSSPFQITTHGVDGVVSLETKYSSNVDDNNSESAIQLEKSSSVYMDLAIIITSSSYFHYSTLLVLQPRYLLINRVGLDLKYCQVYGENHNLHGEVFDLKANDEKTVTYIKGEETDFAKLIQLASNCEEWSSMFTIDMLDEFDIKIPVNPKMFEDKTNLFTYDGDTFFKLVRVIICSENNGLIYIILCSPQNPKLTIDNQTSERIIVWQKNDMTNSIVKISPKTEAIFTWADLLQPEKQVVVSIYDEEDTLSFQKLEKVVSNVYLKDCSGNVFYTVNLKNNNTTRTLKVQTDETANHDEIKAVRRMILGKKFTTITKVKLCLKGIGLSLIDDIPREVFYISCYRMDIKYSNNVIKTESTAENTENVEIYLKNFQIDYSLEDSFPNIMYPKVQVIPGNEKAKNITEVNNNEEDCDVPFIQFLICRKTIFNIITGQTSSKYPQIDLTIQEINLQVHQFVINTLISLSTSLVEVLDFYKKESMTKPKSSSSHQSDVMILNSPLIDPAEYDPTLKTELAVPESIITQKSECSMILIEYLMLSALRINLTLRIDVSSIDIARVPGFIIKILGTVGNAIASITNSPLKFSEIINYNIFTDVGRLVQLLQKHYTRQCILEFYKLIGSSDLLGNPVGFVDKIGTGFYEFFNEPRKGFMKGPTKFGEGIAKGVHSLISNIVGGSFGVVGNITGTLYAATQNLKGEQLHMKLDEPTNLFSGAYEGAKGGMLELGKGIAGIFVNPYQDTKSEGVKGFIKGVGTGILGAIISPFSAALKVGNSVAIGMKNTATLFSRGKLTTSRYRHPRVIVENEPLRAYDEGLAEVHAVLRKLTDYNDHHNKVLFFEDFQYTDPGYEKGTSTLILTERRIMVVYDVKEIAFDLELSKMKSSEVHFVDGQFVLVFKLEDERMSYIKISNLGLCCQLHGILSKMA